MRALQVSRRTGAASKPTGGRPRGLPKLVAALVLSIAMAVSMSSMSAQAADVNLTPGPTVVHDPNSPTGFTGHFVYYNPTATSVRFVGDILLRNWADPSDTTVYQPQDYRPGLMRGGGAYDVEMTNAGDGYWVTDVPLAAGANQYWFYVNNNTSLWVADPANSPIYAPDGLTGTARRAFNKVNVPYDPAKQNYAPLAARVIENPRPDRPAGPAGHATPPACRPGPGPQPPAPPAPGPGRPTAKGTWSYVPLQIGTTTRTVGVYLPPGYDANRSEPYKTIYMQHGSGQDQSDWLNMGDVPVIMDNLIADCLTEPAVVITTNTNYLGSSQQGYPNLRNIVLPFVESNYNVSTRAIDRAFAGLSAGSGVTQSLINYDATKFGYYGPWSGGASVRATTTNVDKPYILYGGGRWDFGLPNANTVAALDQVAFVENLVVAGAHDFNTWNQMFTTFARDYLWHPEAFVADKFDAVKAAVAATDLKKGQKNALTVKLDHAYSEVAKGHNDHALQGLDDYVNQVNEFHSSGKLTDEQAASLLTTTQKIISNLTFWQQ